MLDKLKDDFINSIQTIGPLVLIVLILSLFIPISGSLLLSFLYSSILLVMGSTLFTFGADLSMVVIGNKIGKDLIKSKKVCIILLISLIIGTVVTIAEPDLLVLAEQVTSISNIMLILTISLGVGFCMLIASARSLFGLDLNKLLIFSFIIIFILMFFVPESFISIAFDSGGVTTGTISIPFIITLGIGLTTNRVDKKAKESSFGLVSLASTGPILMVLLLGLFISTNNNMVFDNSIYTDLNFANYYTGFITNFKDVIFAITPIIIVFIVYSLIKRNIEKHEFHKIILGIIITIIGLTIFLVAANVGYLSMGYYIGDFFGTKSYKFILIPVIMILSFFISIAEPAVVILIDQVEEFTEGGISKNLLKVSLALGVSIACGLSILRIFTNTSFIYYALIGYGIALLLTFFIPKIFTAIAFDAGGATGGSLTTAFLLPIAIGVCNSLENDIFTYAFGLASMVSLVPIITIECVGLIYQMKTKIIEKVDNLDDTIIDYNWEVNNG